MSTIISPYYDASWRLADLPPQDVDITPENFERAINDVEMQAPLSDCHAFLVLDTNILIHHFDTITQFVVDAGNKLLPVIIVIPGVVIDELDKQKTRPGLSRLARRASAWLYARIKERKLVKGQTKGETCKGSKDWMISDLGEKFGAERINDQLILDCCMYFQRFRSTLLCSADKNLCIESESAGIPTILPTDVWNSEDITQAVFGGTVENERMMVDDDASVVDAYQPSHELDKLHLKVIDHFTKSLIKLAGRIGGEEIRGQAHEGTSASLYAPRWQKGRHYMEWTVLDVLEYLDSKKRIPVTSPKMEVFLSKPHTNQGARRGQDWSRRDWEVVVGGLKMIGEDWGDISIINSLAELDRHVEGIFAMKMRPT